MGSGGPAGTLQSACLPPSPRRVPCEDGGGSRGQGEVREGHTLRIMSRGMDIKQPGLEAVTSQAHYLSPLEGARGA